MSPRERPRRGVATRSSLPDGPRPAPLPHVFELACSAVHPVRCGVLLTSLDRDDLIELTCEHGAQAHGFTPAWYGPRRLIEMAAMVTQRCG